MRDEDGVYLSYARQFRARRAASRTRWSKAVPLFFVAEAEIFRDRWYWRDTRVAHATRSLAIVYQPLTRDLPRQHVGGLSQNYRDPRRGARLRCAAASRWKIAEPGQVEDDGRHYVEFSFRLDTTLLPRPMQIGIGGEADWSLSVERTQRIN